jgi:hypothetical protein
MTSRERKLRERQRRARQRRRDRKTSIKASTKPTPVKVKAKAPKPRVPAPIPPFLNPDQVLTFPQWCALNNLSERTGRRILAAGKGPVITELSPQRIGITVGNNKTWQASRARA